MLCIVVNLVFDACHACPQEEFIFILFINYICCVFIFFSFYFHVSTLLFLLSVFLCLFAFVILDFQALEEEIESRAPEVKQAVSVGQSLSSLSCLAERGVLAEKLDTLRARYSEIEDRCCRKAALLDQALCNARLFGEDEVEVLNWLAEVEDKLSLVFVKDYKQEVLQKQHADQLVLPFSILSP